MDWIRYRLPGNYPKLNILDSCDTCVKQNSKTSPANFVVRVVYSKFLCCLGDTVKICTVILLVINRLSVQHATMETIAVEVPLV